MCLLAACLLQDGKADMLPKNQGGYDILIQKMGTIMCVKPSTCIKGTTRINCFTTKCAVPCDEEVPFSIACCGIVCV